MTAAADLVVGRAIEVRNLRRTYERKDGWFGRQREEIVALNDAHLEVAAGEVHGLLGPNGAGKSTLCRILATVLVPTSGTATVLGHDVVRDKDAIRPLLALVVGGERGLYYRLTGWQNLIFWGALYGMSKMEAGERATRLLKRVGLGERGADRVETYSRGMKQRLHLARGLMADPKVMLLDEPTSGMDPIATKDFRSLIEEVRDGRTILLATHDMVEAESLCDRVSLIDNGVVVATEAPATLATWITRFERVDVGQLDRVLADKIGALPGVGTVTLNTDSSARIETVAEGAAATVLRMLLDNGHTDLRTSLPGLDEVYVHLLSKPEAEPA